ncbi:MAG: nitrilase-related carbon-nitrogen hydrolase [Phycisphaerales bacterium]
MRAHLVQADTAWEDKAENYRRADALVASASIAPGDLVVLPEMFDTGFSFNLEATADGDGATLGYLQTLARRTAAIVQGSRTVLGPDNRGRNRATILAPDGSLLAEYDKVHPFSFGKETERFSGGDRVMTYPWHAASDPAQRTIVCPAICYDLRFPELFRRGMTMGAELFAIGANWPAPRALHREALARARAIENQAIVLCVNRAGSDPHLTYSGGTMAFGPTGETLGELADGPGVLSVDIDLPALRHWRATFPACKDARLL